MTKILIGVLLVFGLLGQPSTSLAGPGEGIVFDSPPPAFTYDRWLRGGVGKFEKGQIYIVEFWATWCAPCIDAIPHVVELHKKYRAEGVNLISIAAKETGKTDADKLEAVTKVLAEFPSELPENMAFSASRDVADEWGVYGIPAVYIIDREGKIAYIGHPVLMDKPLEMILAGTWDQSPEKIALAEEYAKNQKSTAELGKFMNSLRAALEKEDWPTAIQVLEDNQHVHDRRAQVVELYLFGSHEYAKGYAYARKLAEEYREKPDALFGLMFYLLEEEVPEPDFEREFTLNVIHRVAELVPQLEAWQKARYLPHVAAALAQFGEFDKAIENLTQVTELITDPKAKAEAEAKLTEYRQKLSALRSQAPNVICEGGVCHLPEPAPEKTAGSPAVNCDDSLK